MNKFSLLLALSALAGAAHGTLVFDNITGATPTATSSTPNTFMGDGYNLLSGTTNITGFDIQMQNTTGTSYTGVRGTIYVWGGVNTGTVSAATPAFSNLLGAYSFTSTATYSTGFYYTFQSATPGVTSGITLTNPLSISSPTIGLTVSYAGTTDGVNYATANNLTSIISSVGAPSVGSNVFNGYYRNANSETNGNFTSTLRSLGVANQSVALRVYGSVTPQATPEPSALAALGLGAVAMLRRRKRA